MALTSRSIASAAKRRVNMAQRHVHDAQEKLVTANQELAESIPTGDVGRIRYAHVVTQRAEKEVAEAAGELDVAGELLAEGPVPTAKAEGSGVGVRSLVKNLRSAGGE